MTRPYQPSQSIGARISRKILPFRERRDLKFRCERPIVSFTFDDFPKSAIDNGARVLEAQNWRGTFYACAGLVGHDNHHGKHFEAADLVALEKSGHEIGGHTYSHQDLATVSLENALAEVQKNKSLLAEFGICSELSSFAFPYGSATAALKRELARKFNSLRGVNAGYHIDKADLNGLKSIGVFSQNIPMILALIKSMETKPGWLTLFAHDICETPSSWGCTPEEFHTVVLAVKNSGAIAKPISSAISALEGSYAE